MEITADIATRVLATVDAGLSMGPGKPIPGHMCVEAAVCFALGLPHGDNPPCVDPAVRELKIGINDTPWESRASRARGMRRLAIAQLGTADTLNSVEFASRVAIMTVRTVVPAALRKVADHAPNDATALRAAADQCEVVMDLDAARSAAFAARDAGDMAAAAAAAVYCAVCAVRSAAVAIYFVAHLFVDININATAADMRSEIMGELQSLGLLGHQGPPVISIICVIHRATSAVCNTARVLGEPILVQFAENVTQILIDMGAPGTQFLYLTE